ncbi:hypothetical protein K9N68_03390 [Kovacikia minuta CCNUW1]|uniref:hypothetical protein n=1 Tax=Kovacikia minuta TaxID=2931930 RepID=UPI001CCDCC30|nr:hypothetical protein [Kovacikia minuta]UBF27038.1 hypothetical protein K9N68_03390 [Kovacikia minuta CCNUW1]
MLLSNFELLLKPITPATGTVPNSNRSILQGYFLTVTNLNPTPLNLRLRFNAQTPSLNNSQLLVIRDTTGGNVGLGNPAATPPIPPSRLTAQNTYDFRLNGGDTGLVILQPDITTLNPANVADRVEFRGYVEIFAVLPFPSPGRTFPLLVTPEHRGTFLPSPGGSEFDQLISPLPTISGGSLLNVDAVSDPVIGTLPLPAPSIPNSLGAESRTNGASNGSSPAPENGQQLENIQQILMFMAQQIDDLNQRVPSERKPVA